MKARWSIGTFIKLLHGNFKYSLTTGVQIAVILPIST
jgi:hypothetical protein